MVNHLSFNPGPTEDPGKKEDPEKGITIHLAFCLRTHMSLAGCHPGYTELMMTEFTENNMHFFTIYSFKL